MRALNGTPGRLKRVAQNLAISAHSCPTWIQTCVLAINGRGPDENEQRAYLDFLSARLDEGLPLRGVLLYGLARDSCQPEAPTLSSLPEAWLTAYSERIHALGLDVRITP